MQHEGLLDRVQLSHSTPDRGGPRRQQDHCCRSFLTSAVSTSSRRPKPRTPHRQQGAACEHGIIDALTAAGIDTVADTAYQGGGPAIRTPQRRRRLDPDTGRYRSLSRNQKQVNAAHARQRGPGERVNAQLKNWRILRKIRSSPGRADKLVAAVQTLMIASD